MAARNACRVIFHLCTLAAFVVFSRNPHAAETQTIRAGVYENPPFAMCDGDGCRGMAVDLWEKVAQRLDLRTEYRHYPTLGELVTAGAEGEVDVLVTNLTVTSERAARLRFSYPWFDSGLRIMTRAGEERSVLERLSRSGHLFAYVLLFLLFLVVALAVTLYRREHDGEGGTWQDGFASSLAQVIAVAKSGELPERRSTWQRNLLVSLWMIFGMGILAYVTSTISSAMTAASLRNRGEAMQLADLPGKDVAVLTGSGAESYLGGLGVLVHAYPRVDDAVLAVADGEMTALVADTAVLEYWLTRNPRSGLRVGGEMFHPDKFAFAVRRDHVDLIEKISMEVLLLHETGLVNSLRARYFGRVDMAGGRPARRGLGPEGFGEAEYLHF